MRSERASLQPPADERACPMSSIRNLSWPSQWRFQIPAQIHPKFELTSQSVVIKQPIRNYEVRIHIHGTVYSKFVVSISQYTVEILSLDGDGSFRANRGLETIKTVSDLKNAWGDRQVESIKFAARLCVARSSQAPWRRPSYARSRRRVARSRQALRASRTVIGYDRLSTPADLAPSVLNRIALRKLRWIPLATAHTPVCSTRDLVCARLRTAT
jgi:hypothetical protein